jgi:DNA-binding NtrC family response regulator/pSer/pThr/pTyr-binding forkhead associated (FHA) protein
MTQEIEQQDRSAYRGDETIAPGPRPAPRRGGTPDLLYLVIFDARSSRTFQLPERGEVLIGRSQDADIYLDDNAVSREHAKLILTGREAVLADLNSRNGTTVNGERVTVPRPLASGDTIDVCGVTLVFNSSLSARGGRSLVELAQLCERGEEEVERSLKYDRPLSVLVVRFAAAVEDRRGVERILGAELPRLDVAAWGGPDHLVVLMPESPAADAARAAADLVSALGAGAARAGHAACPEDGCDFHTLLASARAAARSAAPGQVAAAGATLDTRQVGDRSIVVADPAMVRLYALVERLAASDLAVLVCGETGTGKELAASALHHWSARRDRKFLTLNCAALTETLLESELFGHEKGAFTGAQTSKPGLLETAGGGTVLLDEIGELPLTAQAKLLRVLETKRVIRLGDVREREIDIRIVAATNRNLQEEVAAGRFRQDLFFRLGGATVWLPPLRDRKRELPLLAQVFLREACAALGRPPMGVSPAAMQVIATYRWPGNVRELKNVMEYAAATVAEQTVQPWHLENIGGPHGMGARPPQPPAPADPGTTTGALAPAPRFRPIDEELRELEKARMIAALEATSGNQTRAAELIQMPLRTFVAKVKQYGITRRRP